ncbi:MAG: hypothetical protein M3O31_01080 [Acidobacteriota bacterium]|nr:hypothetical protein [Acidobacteriota bacterium]
MSILRVLQFLEIALCVWAFCFLAAKKAWSDYLGLGVFLAVRASSDVILVALRTLAPHIGRTTVYHLYFYAYWAAFALEMVLVLVILYSIIQLTMAPLKGLQSLGGLVFNVVAMVSVVVSMWQAFAPSMKLTGADLLITAVSQIQRTESVLVLCILLFLTFAMQAMGLSLRSRPFGVVLGLGLMGTNDLVQTAVLAFRPNVSTGYAMFNGVLFCGILSLWMAYFAMPEPERQELPADSPLRRWDKQCLEYRRQMI